MLMVYLRTAVCASILLTGLAGWACSCSSPGPAPCGDLKNAGMAFVGTVTHIENPPDEKKGTFQGGTSRYRFTVDEDINGMKANEVDVYSGRGGADCSFHFSLGKTYLVFPYKQNDGRLFATICSETQAIEDAGPLLEELRAQRDGKPFASLYGVLRRTQQPYEATSSADYDQPIPHITIELHGEKNTLSTQTDDNGTYRFYSVPADKYRFVAKLPVNLALGEAILDDPDPGIELPANSCYRQDLEALPTSKIRGRVLGPDGNPLKYADVELFRPDKYSDSERGWWEFQDKEEGLFEFKHVAPGAYILVFHNSNNRDADIPYERTFYPNARDLASATPIVIQDGEQILNADIHAIGRRQTRELVVRVHWTTEKLPEYIFLDVKGPEEECCSAQEKLAPGKFKIALFSDSHYKVSAWEDCGMRWVGNTGTPIGRRETEVADVDGSDSQVAQIDLWLRDTSCKPYPKLKMPPEVE